MRGGYGMGRWRGEGQNWILREVIDHLLVGISSGEKSGKRRAGDLGGPGGWECGRLEGSGDGGVMIWDSRENRRIKTSLLKVYKIFLGCY